MELTTPEPTGAAAEACRAVVDALPDTLLDLERRTVTVTGGPGAAWGDPAIELRCGADLPEVLSPTEECAAVVNDVGWFGPSILDEPPDGAATFLAVSLDPVVSLTVPEDYYASSGSALAELSGPLTAALTPVQRCV